MKYEVRRRPTDRETASPYSFGFYLLNYSIIFVRYKISVTFELRTKNIALDGFIKEENECK